MDRVLQVTRERRSVRRYTGDPVDDATVDGLLEAAVWAPSAVNAQPWAFGVIRDRPLLERYADRAKAVYLTDPPVAELAASATGLGTCPIGLALPLLNQREVKNELGVPASLVAALPILVGHPAEQPHATTRNPPHLLYRR